MPNKKLVKKIYMSGLGILYIALSLSAINTIKLSHVRAETLCSGETVKYSLRIFGPTSAEMSQFNARTASYTAMVYKTGRYQSIFDSTMCISKVEETTLASSANWHADSTVGSAVKDVSNSSSFSISFSMPTGYNDTSDYIYSIPIKATLGVDGNTLEASGSLDVYAKGYTGFRATHTQDSYASSGNGSGNYKNLYLYPGSLFTLPKPSFINHVNPLTVNAGGKQFFDGANWQSYPYETWLPCGDTLEDNGWSFDTNKIAYNTSTNLFSVKDDVINEQALSINYKFKYVHREVTYSYFSDAPPSCYLYHTNCDVSVSARRLICSSSSPTDTDVPVAVLNVIPVFIKKVNLGTPNVLDPSNQGGVRATNVIDNKSNVSINKAGASTKKPLGTVVFNASADFVSALDGSHIINPPSLPGAWSSDGVAVQGTGSGLNFNVINNNLKVGEGYVDFTPNLSAYRWVKCDADGVSNCHATSETYPPVRYRVAVWNVGIGSSSTRGVWPTDCTNASTWLKGSDIATFNYAVQTPGFGMDLVNTASLTSDGSSNYGEQTINTAVLKVANTLYAAKDIVSITAKQKITIPEAFHVLSHYRFMDSGDSDSLWAGAVGLYSATIHDKAQPLTEIKDFNTGTIYQPVRYNNDGLFSIPMLQEMEQKVVWPRSGTSLSQSTKDKIITARAKYRIPDVSSIGYVWNQLTLGSDYMIPGETDENLKKYPNVTFATLGCANEQTRTRIYGDIYTASGINGEDVTFGPARDKDGNPTGGVSVISAAKDAIIKNMPHSNNLKMLPIYNFSSREVSIAQDPNRSLARSIILQRIMDRLSSNERKLVTYDKSINKFKSNYLQDAGDTLSIKTTIPGAGAGAYAVNETINGKSAGLQRYLKLDGVELRLNPARNSAGKNVNKLRSPVVSSSNKNIDDWAGIELAAQCSSKENKYKCYDATNPEGGIWIVDGGLHLKDVTIVGPGAIIVLGPVKIEGDVKLYGNATTNNFKSSLTIISLSKDLFTNTTDSTLASRGDAKEIMSLDSAINNPNRIRAISLDNAKGVNAFLFAPFGTITTGKNSNGDLHVTGAMVANAFEFVRSANLMEFDYDAEAVKNVPPIISKLFESDVLLK